MANVVLFHPLMGLVAGVEEAAERMRRAGHAVFAPDLFEGRTFNEDAPSQAYLQETGIKEIMLRAGKAAAAFPADCVYAGFSLGAVIALRFAARKPGALGCLAIAGAVSLPEMGVEAWPGSVPLQLHYAEGDPGIKGESVEALGEAVRSSGASFAHFAYTCAGHLFTFPELADYDPASAALFWEGALDFLASV